MTIPDTEMEYVLGLGGFWLDPGGAATICRRAQVMGIHVPTPYPQNSLHLVYDSVKALPVARKLIMAGDSCGCTRIIQIAKDVHPRVIDAMYCIQPSFYCQAGSVPVSDNVRNLTVFYSNWALTWGLGVYKPPLEIPPTVEGGGSLYDGQWRTGNGGKTKARYLYVPDLHPADDDRYGVQDPMFSDITRVLEGK
jgi:hypothetical protein